MIIKKFVESVPYPIINFIHNKIGIPSFLRYGKVFWNTYNFLQKSQWWSREKLEEYQLQQLRKLLHCAYENVPYYYKILKEQNLRPGDIHNIEDFSKIPCLDKNTFKSHFNELLSRNIKTRNLPLTHTSGTTGKPLQFYQSYSENEKEWAFISHQWSRVGYKPGDPRVELRGAIINRKIPVSYNPLSKVLRLSPRIESKDVAQLYLDKMKSVGAMFLHGYPSAIATLASLVRRNSLIVPFQLKAIFFASEAIYDWEREIVEEVFNCPVFSHYGLAEHVVLAAECEESHYYHCVPQYGITEIDPETHEIIATGFFNYLNPFIRYRTTDIASSPVFSRCEHCGRNYFPIFERVEGRIEDFIITKDGIIISPAIITHPFKDLKTIKNTQIIQTAVDHIVMRVSTFEGASDKSEKELRQLCADLKEVLGTEMQIEVEVVDKIEMASSGKFKWIKSEVSKGRLEKGLETFFEYG